ncbi:uncharacterized protein K452DRAFT_217820 [Aplosporella prunicola CBS 121167]|uniref:Nuclear segregation protein n=1 Tax=Aplosporella prunicola CBS 121167 TaxID=1176127 RepID=A0A6A6BVI0_9PEZI|nr:uncharacterized protein K452DRAFT_217820 [Aplosporella prunicola CBS 121167]KAF2147343.1 hypothetical protein K452DRAFT_217820 [Aplosporella prunicola CBS 121167]
MAEVATPSAAAMATGEQKSDKKQQVVKPEKPDEEKFRAELAKLKKEQQAASEKLEAAKAKVETAFNNKDSPAGKRAAELRTELGEIRKKQQAGKGSRAQTLEQIKKLDEQLKSRIAEQKTARGRVNFKSVEDVDREIKRLEDQVNSGTMKIVDEKKALADVSSLHKQKKSFAGFEQGQKGIDDTKAKIADLRKTMDDPESKALSDRYTEITKELDAIRAEQDAASKNLTQLKDQREKARSEYAAKKQAVTELSDNFYQAKRDHRAYEQEAYKVRQAKKEAERKAYESAKRRQIADQRLEEASAPAYTDEILTAEGLIRYFDPSALPAKETADTNKFAATATRTVDDSGLKGMKVVKKDDDDYFIGTGGKKGKKGRKNKEASPAATPAEGKFNLSIGIIEQLSKLNVEAPASQADVPAVVKKLQEKSETWKKDQDKKTQENIEKAKKEIEKLEAEGEAATNGNGGAKDLGNKPSAKNQQVNGNADAGAELAQEKDGAADAAAELKEEEKEQSAEA